MSEDASAPLVSESMRQAIASASWIRQMFEEGRRLKTEFGEENVLDFSLGNPSVPPPQQFFDALKYESEISTAEDHRYMPNTGRPDVRAHFAAELSSRHDLSLAPEHVVMTCGAAGALNIFLKTILDPGDEVIILTPYFPEYVFYITNHGGVPVVVESAEDLQPDLEAIASRMTERTRAICINTPNNPSGVCYDQTTINKIGKLVDRASENNGAPCFLIMDEVYRRVVYGDTEHPSVFAATKHSVAITSFSKDLGLAGERIGNLAWHPELTGADDLLAGLSVATRTLGFVNAPALMQRVVMRCGDASVNVDRYRHKRDMLYPVLRDAGYEIPKPDGAFFLFPKAPGGDDLAFCKKLRETRVLTVPGRGFGTPGHFRISYAVPDDVIERAIPHFVDALRT